MMDRRSPLQRLFELHLPLLVIVLFALGPYVWMMMTSIKTNTDIGAWPVRYWPQAFTSEHYHALLERTSFGGNLVNSFIIATGACMLGLSVSLPAAYAFSRYRFRGRRLLMTQFLVINMFPIVLIIIPLFVLMRNIGLLDTFIGIILGHSTFAVPFSIWMLTSYMNAIPKDLDEAARIDGATTLEVLRLIILPVIMPGLVTTGIYIFVTSWNEYLFAMMLSGQNVRTVTVALQLVIGEFSVQWGLLTAAGTLIALPVTLLFLLVQKRLVSGLTSGAVKS